MKIREWMGRNWNGLLVLSLATLAGILVGTTIQTVRAQKPAEPCTPANVRNRPQDVGAPAYLEVDDCSWHHGKNPREAQRPILDQKSPPLGYPAAVDIICLQHPEVCNTLRPAEQDIPAGFNYVDSRGDHLVALYDDLPQWIEQHCVAVMAQTDQELMHKPGTELKLRCTPDKEDGK